MKRQKKLTQSEIDGVQYRRAKTWQIALSQLAGGSGMVFYALVTLMSYVANEGYGIVMAVVGVLLTVTRIFDGLIDPFLAVIIDRVNTRFGKLRLFMGIGWIIRSLAVLLLFVWGSDAGHGIVYFVAMYVLYIIGSSIYDITSNMVGTVMTNDPRQRPAINVWSTVYNYLIPTILGLVSTLVILPMFGNRYTTKMLAFLCLIYIPVSLVFMLVGFAGITEVDKPENFQGVSAGGAENSVRLRDMFLLVKDNRPFQMYIISSVSAKLAQQTTSQAMVSTLLFGVLIGNIQFGTILGTISMLPAILFAIIGAKYAGKFGNKKTTITWTQICLAVSVVSIVFLAAIDMKQISKNIIIMVVFFVLLLLVNGAKMCVTTANGAMRSDIVDYELDRSGKYLPAVVTATYNFIDQLISSLGSTIAAVGVSLIGYTATSPQPTDAATPAIKWMTLFLYYGVPVIGWVIGLIAMKFYKLSKEEMVNVQKRIEAKKEETVQAEARN
jgi:Na+/melibiose symporter-like transporter